MLVERHEAPARELHALDMPDDGVRRIWDMRVTAPAVVLGSTQSEDVVDAVAASRAGVEVARRRSGGGAVWVAPGDPIWIDVCIPRGDPLWDDDVGRSFLPIGRAWVSALDHVGVRGAAAHEGGLVHARWSDLVCFAGVGPGEVLVDDAKIVGMSQRRTRAGARFQCAVVRRWDPEPLRAVLVDPPPPGALDHVAVGLDAPGRALLDALVAALD